MIMMIEFSYVNSHGSCCGGCGCCGNSNSNNAQSFIQTEQTYDPNDAVYGLKFFNGDWIGLDYKCEGGVFQEQVNFPDSSGQIFANKITGDRCVKAGQVTIRFKSYPSKIRYNTRYDVLLTLGSPQNPGSSAMDSVLIIQGKDNFTVNADRFVRGRLVGRNIQYIYAPNPVPPPAPVVIVQPKPAVLPPFIPTPAAPKPCKTETVKEIVRQVLDSNGRVISSTREIVTETIAERISDDWKENESTLKYYNDYFVVNKNTFTIYQ